MKILALIPSFYGWIGSAVNERQLIIALSRKVDRCYVITFPSIRDTLRLKYTKKAYSLPKNVVTFEFPIPHRYLITIFARIIASCLLSVIGSILFLHKKVDLIYIRDSSLALGFLLSAPLRHITVVKIAALQEDELLGSKLSKVAGHMIFLVTFLLDRLAILRSDHVATMSSEESLLIEARRYVKPRKPWLIIPPGVNLESIGNLGEREEYRKKDKTWIGFLGSLEWWQGVDIMVRAMGIIKSKSKNVKLLIVGDGSRRSEIEKLCSKLNIDYEISGFVPHDEALRYLMSFDVMVVPSLKISTTESIIPIKIIEAWALSIPVVATRRKIFIDKYKDGEELVLCEPDPHSIAEAILKVLTNDALRTKLKQKGPELAREYDYNKIVESIIDVVAKQDSH